MKYKGTLIVVKDCNRALKFYSDMFGFHRYFYPQGFVIQPY